MMENYPGCDDEGDFNQKYPELAKMNATDKLLTTRATTHGDYTDNASNTQSTMRIWEKTPNWRSGIPNDQIESLHMIAHKISRILCGDNNEADHWDDIAGYAKLSADRCRDRKAKIYAAEELVERSGS